eukprot:gene38142-43206_t
MEVNDQTLGVLKNLLGELLSTYDVTRKNAEAVLKSTESQNGFPILVLTLVQLLVPSTAREDVAIRLSGALVFKNMVKKRWQPSDEDADQVAPISPADKEAIKKHLVELMCTAPKDVQSQLAE